MMATELERHVHIQCLYHEKLHNLDLALTSCLPENYQIALESHYGILYNPFVACKAAEAFEVFGTPESHAFVQTVSIQAAILHPDRLSIKSVLAAPFLMEYVSSHPRPYAYCIARLLGRAILEKAPESDADVDEILLLMANVRQIDCNIYYALCDRDYELLEELREQVLNDSDSKYYKAWWNRFFYLYLDLRILEEEILPGEPFSEAYRQLRGFGD